MHKHETDCTIKDFQFKLNPEFIEQSVKLDKYDNSIIYESSDKAAI